MSTDAERHVNPTELPDDPAYLKPLIVQLFETLQKAQRRVEQLEHYMDLLLRRVFGRSSEKLDPRQLVLAFAESQAEINSPVSPELPAVAESAATHARDAGSRRTTP